jgi:hypothetical protein
MSELGTCHSRSDRRRHREADAEPSTLGSCRRVLRHRVEHLPREALGVERGFVDRLGLQLTSALASPMAMRRSSMSSIVKSSRAASPAAVVRTIVA